MRHFLSLLALAPLALSACTFTDGDPWGRAHIAVEASAALPAGERAGDDYVFDTPYGYRITLSSFGLIAEGLTLETGESAGSSVSFDPGNPPPGYSTCHNGHCHHDDGRLVDYEDIIAELAGGDEGEASSSSLTQHFSEEALLLSAEPRAFTKGECTQGCQLPAGELHHGELSLHGVSLELRVQDLRTDDDQRLSEDLVFQGEVHLHHTIELSLHEHFGRGEDPNFDLLVELRVLSSLWDRFRWDEISAASDLGLALEEAFEERLSEHLEVHTQTRRWR